MSRLIANRAFRYASRELAAGEEFEAESKDVLVLTRVNNPLARELSGGDEPEMTSLGPETEPGLLLHQNTKSKRYNRRDMRAKD